MDVDPNDIILNCYRLADRFHQSPDVFLNMPISEVQRHVHWTVQLIKAQNAAQGGGDDE